MSSIREIQDIELQMLEAVDTLCKKHGLRYTLYCGTLLGAIRHRGFIPWDDDIDIAMPLADYHRFLEVAHELPAGYTVQWPGHPSTHLLTWAKVFADGTTQMPVVASEIDVHWGVSIDIYPFIGAAPTKTGEFAQAVVLKTANFLRCADFYRCQLEHDLEDDPKRRRVKSIFVSIPRPLRMALATVLLKLGVKDPEKAERIGTIDRARFAGKYLRADWDDMTTAEFEGHMFPIPVKYDAFLRAMYGDYMQLPPEDQRGGHYSRSRVIRDAKHDYREYKREIARARQ